MGSLELGRHSLTPSFRAGEPGLVLKLGKGGRARVPGIRSVSVSGIKKVFFPKSLSLSGRKSQMVDPLRAAQTIRDLRTLVFSLGLPLGEGPPTGAGD